MCKHTLQRNCEIRSVSCCEMCQAWCGFWATRGDITTVGTSTFSRAPCEGDTMLVWKNMHRPWFGGRRAGNIAWNVLCPCSAKFCFGWNPFVVDQRSYSYIPSHLCHFVTLVVGCASKFKRCGQLSVNSHVFGSLSRPMLHGNTLTSTI